MTREECEKARDDIAAAAHVLRTAAGRRQSGAIAARRLSAALRYIDDAIAQLDDMGRYLP
jgi:hypothetical protein